MPQGHDQDPLDGTRLAGQGQFTHNGERARPVEGDLSTPQEQPQRDRQVEAAGILLEVGGGKVDHNPIDRPSISRIDDRPLNSMSALANGGFGQAN
jgi:hypothetical protein